MAEPTRYPPRRSWKRFLGGIVSAILLLPIPVFAGGALNFTWSGLPSTDGAGVFYYTKTNSAPGDNDTNNELVFLPPSAAFSTGLTDGPITFTGTVSGTLNGGNTITETLTTNTLTSGSYSITVAITGGSPSSNQFTGAGTKTEVYGSSTLPTENVTVTFQFTNTVFSSSSSTPYNLVFNP